jgi:DNA-binding transcriptional LysR family regulator
MDRLHAMGTLIAAVEAGSLSAAARQLRTPLATVSRRVSDLERQLNARLLKRSARRLTLTPAGESYVAACRRILEDIAEAERAAAGEYRAPRGELTVTTPFVFGRLHVVPIVVEFLKAYTDIDVRLRLADHVLSLQDERIDVAVRVGTLADSSLVAIPVGTIRRIVCASPAYFAARGVPRTPHDLAHHDCVTFEGIAAPRLWAFPGEPAVAIRSRLAVNGAEAAVDAAVAGAGIAHVLSYQAADALRRGALVIALKEFEPPPLPVHVVHAGERPLPLKVRSFLDFLGPRLRAALVS